MFAFFAGMLLSYYVYSAWVFGFFPTHVFIRWGIIAAASPIAAYLAWFGRGNGWIAAFCAAMPIGLLAAEGYPFFTGVPSHMFFRTCLVVYNQAAVHEAAGSLLAKQIPMGVGVMSVYDFSAKTNHGELKPLADYRGKVLLIVNTASRCGFTPQYQGLQKLYDEFHASGFEVLAFPCNQFHNQEPGSDEEIRDFCQVNYGVTFPLFAKVDVKGPNAHPLFVYLTKQAPGLLTDGIKWNFTKFLIDRNGSVVRRYAPVTRPERIAADIKRLIQEEA